MISAAVYRNSLNHFGEEVCGDTYKITRTDDSKIIVLSDGLGSGIKASILSILTTEILATMVEEGVSLAEVVNTVTKTLPVCKKRGIAYSTFTIAQIFKNGKIKIVNYDNPAPIILKNREIIYIDYVKKIINEKEIKIYEFKIEEGDMIFLMSDGVVHAGLGNLMDFGWGEENIAKYLKRLNKKTLDIKEIVDNLIEVTESYYGFEPGDDATVIGMKVTAKPNLKIFTGPPLDPKTDDYYVKEFLEYKGKKVICGGTTSNIISRISGREIEIDLEGIGNTEIPPSGKMQGIDLITEGVLSLKKVNEILSKCEKNLYEIDLSHKKLDAAEKLIEIMRDCDYIKILVGRKVNAFYHNPALPFDMSIRSNLVRTLVGNLKRLDKEVEVEYC